MEEERWRTLLDELLRREGMIWELVDGAGRVWPAGRDATVLGKMLRVDPALTLVGKGPQGEVCEVRWTGDAPAIRRSTLAHLYDGTDLRPERLDPRIDRRVLQEVLQRREKETVGPTRRRRWAVAAFLGRLIDLLAGVEEPYILECGTGPSPLGLVLVASLARAGLSPRFLGLDASPEAVAAARALASRLGLEGVELVVGELGDDLFFDFSPHLLLAVHLCGAAVYTAIDLGRRLEAGAMALVPCCAPAGAWEEAGFSYGKAGPYTLFRSRLDRVGFLLTCLDRLAGAGYRVETFEAYLPPWREVEIVLLAYRPGPLGKTRDVEVK
ncbi:MAG: methyltransferase [Bacillota bacterium]